MCILLLCGLFEILFGIFTRMSEGILCIHYDNHCTWQLQLAVRLEIYS